MKIEGNKLTADEGCKITQANRKEWQEPMLFTTLYLTEFDKVENWKEVTTQEGEQMLKEWEEKYLNDENEPQ